jgi:RNA polymerase-interacting CarD/CdnL/TRCF family regulator
VKVGDVVVVRGRALGRVNAIRKTEVHVTPLDAAAHDGSMWEIASENVELGLRPLVTPEVAHAAIASLRGTGAVDERDVADRSIAYRRATKSGELAEQIRELGSIYRRAEHDYPERQYLDPLERAVYGELALVLDLPRRRLKADLRSAILGEQPPTSLLLPDRSAELAAVEQPPLAGYDVQGAFAIDTKLAVGELSAELVLAAKPGIWFAYTHGDMDDDDHHLVAIHRDHVASTFAPKSRGAVSAEAASVSLCDAAQLDDREFVEATRMEGSGAHGTHCFTWHVGGDGTFPVSTATAARKVVYIRIDFT